MTEVEKIAYAKMFIDKLSSGINPLDDTRIPEDDIVNNTRISNCLSYVSTILKRVIDQDEETIAPRSEKKQRKSKKKQYYILPEQIARFEFSEEPIRASEIVCRISKVGPQIGVKSFPKKKILKWLAICGLITIDYENKEQRYMPTTAGEEIGISSLQCQGVKGPYWTLTYDINAQHLIIDNIDSILAVNTKAFLKQYNLDNHCKIWSPEDREKVVESFNNGMTISEIALLVKRTEKAVRIHLRKSGIDVPEPQESEM